MTETPLLEVHNLTKTFFGRHHRKLLAVDNVSFAIHRGESFGLVGESGCGKSTVARLIMGLEQPDSGEIILNGQHIHTMSERALRPLRMHYQMVFQDAASSLNPRRRIAEILADPIRQHHLLPEAQIPDRVAEILETVGLQPDMASRYPHEFSGGQKQRICIARALGLQPDLLVLDEPVSALDVSIQAQILNLLRDLQQRLHLTYLFIGHGLGAVRYISDQMAVMYLGRILETGPSETLFTHCLHPYTLALLDASPSARYADRNRNRVILRGEIESLPASGCPLLHRCPAAADACAHQLPVLHEITPGHSASCTRAELLRR